MRAANTIPATGKDREDGSTTIIAGTATGIAIGEIATGIGTTIGIETATRPVLVGQTIVFCGLPPENDRRQNAIVCPTCETLS